MVGRQLLDLRPVTQPQLQLVEQVEVRSRGQEASTHAVAEQRLPLDGACADPLVPGQHDQVHPPDNREPHRVRCALRNEPAWAPGQVTSPRT